MVLECTEHYKSIKPETECQSLFGTWSLINSEKLSTPRYFLSGACFILFYSNWTFSWSSPNFNLSYFSHLLICLAFWVFLFSYLCAESLILQPCQICCLNHGLSFPISVTVFFFFSFGFLHSYFMLSPSCSLSFSHCSGVCTTWPIALFNCRAFGEIEFCRGISRLFTLSSSLPWKFPGEHLFSSLVFSQCPYPCLAYHRS